MGKSQFEGQKRMHPVQRIEFRRERQPPHEYMYSHHTPDTKKPILSTPHDTISLWMVQSRQNA